MKKSKIIFIIFLMLFALLNIQIVKGEKKLIFSEEMLNTCEDGLYDIEISKIGIGDYITLPKGKKLFTDDYVSKKVNSCYDVISNTNKNDFVGSRYQGCFLNLDEFYRNRPYASPNGSIDHVENMKQLEYYRKIDYLLKIIPCLQQMNETDEEFYDGGTI